MFVYVGIDGHRKRSQVAVIEQDGGVIANRNVANGCRRSWVDAFEVATGVSIPRVDPTVTAATIAVSGTVIVGLAGFGAAIWNTRQTIAHDRDNRLRDQRAAAYVDVIASVRARQHQRIYDTRMTQVMDPATEARQQAFLATFKKTDWWVLEARVVSFGSQVVNDALKSSSSAYDAAINAFDHWQERWKRAGAHAYDSERDATAADERAALTALQEALITAEKQDDHVVALIQAELHGRTGG